MTIQPLTAAYWPLMRASYEQAIATGNATFQTEAPTWEDWNRGHLAYGRLVAVDTGYGGASREVLSWAALSLVSSRCVYGGVAGVSVYVASAARGRGVGRQLLAALAADSKAHGLWTLQTSIFPENTTSIGIHVGAGSREVGRRERISQLHDGWRDTVLLERRCLTVGTPAPTLLSSSALPPAHVNA